MIVPSVPPLRSLYLYTTDECNLACKHCWITARRRRSSERPTVPVSLYRTVIEQAMALGLRYVKISGGEALLRRADILELLELTHKFELATRLETNGTLIDVEVANVLQRTRTAVSISLDGSTAKLHEAIRLIPGCFDQTEAALSLLRERGVPVEIILALHRGNREDLDGILRIASGLNGSNLKINPIIASGRARMMEQRGELLTVAELWKFLREVEDRYRASPVPISVTSEPAFYDLDSIRRARPGGGRCGFKNLLGILADGSVSFCGMGYRYSQYVLGKLEEVDLADLWRDHPVLAEIRRVIPDQLEGICSNCILKRTCQGACRSNAFDLYGSITAPSPHCQELYEEGLFPRSRTIDPHLDTPYSAYKAILPLVS